MDASHLKFVPVPCERRANMNYIRPNPLKPRFHKRIPLNNSIQNERTSNNFYKTKKEILVKTHKPINKVNLNNFSNISVRMKDLNISLNTSNLDRSLVNITKSTIPKIDVAEAHPKFNKKDKSFKTEIKHKQIDLGYSNNNDKLQSTLHTRMNSEQMNATLGINFYINDSQNVVISCENINVEKDKDYCYDNTFYKTRRKYLLPNLRTKQQKELKIEQAAHHGAGNLHKHKRHSDALSQQDSFEELLEKMEYEIKNPEDPFAEKNAKFEEYYKSGFFKF